MNWQGGTALELLRHVSEESGLRWHLDWREQAVSAQEWKRYKRDLRDYLRRRVRGELHFCELLGEAEEPPIRPAPRLVQSLTFEAGA